MRVDQFGGVQQNAAPQALVPQQFQIDQGGERFETERWRRRKGMRHSNTFKFADPITSMLGFDLPGPFYGVLLVSGNNLYGLRRIQEA